jgi:hypothetical protein
MKIPLHFEQSKKTLFVPAPGTRAILVTLKAGRRRQRVMEFKDVHAALDWAIAQSAAFVYFHGPDVTHN